MTTSPTGSVRARRDAGTSKSRLMKSLREALITAVFVGPGALLLALMSIYPMFVLLRMSVSSVGISNLIGFWPFVGVENFVVVLSSTTFQTVAVQTIVFVVFVLVATMLVGLIVAVVLRPSRGFSLVTQTTVVLVWTLPLVIVGAFSKFLLSSQGAVNQALQALGLIREPIPFLSEPSTVLTAIAVVTVWVGVPFAALVIKSAILDVPEELLDAARVDGAKSRQVITKIVLPMIRPTLLILAVLTVVGAFKAFDLIYTMTTGGPGTSSNTISFLGYVTAFQSYQFGQAGAISVIAMLIVLGLAIAYIAAVRKEER